MDTMSMQQNLVNFYLKQAHLSLSRKPEGSLTIDSSRNNDQYYHRCSPSEKKGTYISKKEQTLIHALAQKDYDQKFIQEAERISKKLALAVRDKTTRELHLLYSDLSSVYTNLPQSRQKLVTPYVLPDKAYAEEWLKNTCPGKGFLENDSEIWTENGEHVRSKSEKIIADKLLKLKIPYKYEQPLKTKLLGTIYPDFILLDVWNRQEVIFEHFGLMNSASYCEQTLKKFDAYIQEGYSPGISFMFTMETDSKTLNMKCLESLLRRRFPHAI